MPSKSKTKGNSWERDVAKFLSELYDDTFVRIPSSGAYTGGMNSYRKAKLTENQIAGRKGDIQPPDEWKHWNNECKNYADFPFHQLFYTDVKILDEWIDQLYDAGDEGDLNLILMKFNRKGKWVAFETNCKFRVRRGIKYKNWTFCSWDDFWGKPSNIKLVKKLST